MESAIDKILFLDIDHVLTNTDIDYTSFRHLDPEKYHLSDANLKILDKLLEKTGAKIVIASNWRKFIPPHTAWCYEGKWYQSTLEPFKEMYKGLIIGMLPPFRHINKAACLKIWLEDNPWFLKNGGRYAILEDDLKEGYQDDPEFSKHLVLTDARYGLTEEDASKAVALLS